MSKHTQEPWCVQPLSMSLDIHIHTARGNADPIIASVNGYGRDHAVAEANARRIVACVNACAGIPTEALDSGALAEALVFACEHGFPPLAKLREEPST